MEQRVGVTPRAAAVERLAGAYRQLCEQIGRRMIDFAGFSLKAFEARTQWLLNSVLLGAEG